MNIKAITTTILVAFAIGASAQITKNQKYDWGWSYKLEMPETGLKCEFPEKPNLTPLAYGYMAAAAHNDELYVVAKLENPHPYDIICKTEEFAAQLHKTHGLKVSGLTLDEVQTKNGNLTVSGRAQGDYATFFVDAMATKDALTIFLYAYRKNLSVPGHFFASSYSIYDAPAGQLSYLTTPKTTKHAPVLQYTNNGSLVQLANTPIEVAWPGIPELEVRRHQTTYHLEKNDSRYTAHVLALGSEVSYAYFNTFINKQQQEVVSENMRLINDETDVAFLLGSPKEAYFRKLTYTTATKTSQHYYVAADGQIFIQILDTPHKAAPQTQFLNTFERSVRNHYDTRALVTR